HSSLHILDLHSFPTRRSSDLENSIPIAHDFAYNTVSFNDPAPSMMQAEGAKDIAVEFGSLSKSYNMTGWRIGYVVGHKEIIKGRSEEHTSELQSRFELVCRLL